MNKEILKSKIEEELPEFVKMCEREDAEAVLLHQDSFSINELELLGSAIKFAGFCGKLITIVPSDFQSPYREAK